MESITCTKRFLGGVHECLKRKKMLKTTKDGMKKETNGSNSFNERLGFGNKSVHWVV